MHDLPLQVDCRCRKDVERFLRRFTVRLSESEGLIDQAKQSTDSSSLIRKIISFVDECRKASIQRQLDGFLSSLVYDDLRYTLGFISLSVQLLIGNAFFLLSGAFSSNQPSLLQRI